MQNAENGANFTARRRGGTVKGAELAAGEGRGELEGGVAATEGHIGETLGKWRVQIKRFKREKP